MTISSLTSSILSSYGYGTSKTDTSAQVAAALEKLAQQSAAQTSSTTTSSGTQVSISPAALAAAAAKADNDKDFGALATEVRAGLDKQYAAGTSKNEPDLSGLSGRALAAIALNKDDQFSGAERTAAKKLLNQQTRDSYTSSVGQSGSAGMAAIASFSSMLASQYDSMSPEERQARGWTEQFRDANADFAAKAASTDTSMPSLFDQM